MLLNSKTIKAIIFYVDTYLAMMKPEEMFELKNLIRKYDCWICTEKKEFVSEVFNNENIHILPWSLQFPDMMSLNQITTESGCKLENIGYISDDLDSLKNARNSILFTIFLAQNTLRYEVYGGFCPDLICGSFYDCLFQLENSMCLYYGEALITLGVNGILSGCKLIKMDLGDLQEGYKIPIISAGRYFGINHYLHAIHAYSNAILINKKKKSKLYRRFDDLFAQILSKEIIAFQSNFSISCDAICAVPDKPGKENKFEAITTRISELTGIVDDSKSFLCIKDYEDQKTKASAFDRAYNVKDSFQFNGSLNGKTIALIDDIVTTGSTLSECVKVLYEAGAKQVICFALAYNQFDCSYIGNMSPFLSRMNEFRFNAKTLIPFYSGIGNYDVVLAEIFKELNDEVISITYPEDFFSEDF